MREFDFLIIGAGIAGTSCAHWLAEKHTVAVLEMEAQPGYHTTGRSIAVYTEAYGPRPIRALAKSGRDFFINTPKSFSQTPLSRPQGFLFAARADQKKSIDALLASVRELSPGIHPISPAEAVSQVPVLRRDYLDSAFLDPSALALDVAAIHQGYIRGLKSKGGEIITKAVAERFERMNGKWHVTTPQGVFAAPVVINAAGAWADVVADRMGARKIGLVPMRRTAVAFVPPNVPVSSDWPVVIDTDDEWFFKVDAGTVLASPCDEAPVEPQDIQPEEMDIAIAVDRLERATTMKVARLQRSWAGLRSFVKDRSPVVGFAPDLDGLFWCSGQGGYGIETSNGMGRTCASLATGNGLPADVKALGVTERDLAPMRLWDGTAADALGKHH